MVIKVPFYSWNKCSIFLGLTIFGTKKRQMTIFVVGKNLKKKFKMKNNTIFGKGSIFASGASDDFFKFKKPCFF